MPKAPVELGPSERLPAPVIHPSWLHTTADLTSSMRPIGQPARHVVDFGLGMKNDGYNIFRFRTCGHRQGQLPSATFSTAKRLPSGTVTGSIAQFSIRICPTPSAWPPEGPGFRRRWKAGRDLQAASPKPRSEDTEAERATPGSGEKQGGQAELPRREGWNQGFTMVRTPAVWLRPWSKGRDQSRGDVARPPQEGTAAHRPRMERSTRSFSRSCAWVRQDEREGREAIRELDRQVTTFAANT